MVKPSLPWCSRNVSATWSFVRWTAGAMMWLGGSWRSWMMYSPRSVSTGVTPIFSRWSFSPISSDTIDFDLAIVRAPTLLQRSAMMRRASSAVILGVPEIMRSIGSPGIRPISR